MRILVYGINYSPELTGIGKYTSEMTSWLSKQGHDITVVTAMPYYPEWRLHPDYKRKFWHKEIIDGVKVYRCPLYVPARINSVKRIIHEFSFLLAATPLLLMNLFQKKYDLVLSVSPPFHLGLLPLIYSKVRGSKLITHIQDLQVDAAKDLGMINNKQLLNLMFSVEKYFLRNSQVVSTISEGMLANIQKKGIEPGQTCLFPNWVDISFIHPLSKADSLRKAFGYSNDDKIVMYSGNLGEKQGLETLIDVASYFNASSACKFLIVGNGGGRKKLENLAAEAKLTNLKFFPLQSYQDLPALLATPDIHLVLQKKSASDLVMPSKLVSILAAGGFSIVTAVEGSSLYKLVSESETGIIIEPENTALLIKCIEESLKNDLTEFKSNARRYAEGFLAKEPIMKKWEQQLKSTQNQGYLNILGKEIS